MTNDDGMPLAFKKFKVVGPLKGMVHGAWCMVHGGAKIH
jgi:hypothetical protein